jgi:Domain of unknown function (DUF3331)
VEQVSPWSQVVSLLSHLSGGDDNDGGESWRIVQTRGVRTARTEKPGEAHQAMSDADSRNKITAIERQDDVSALISWCDPTMCHYVDQVWRQIIARRNGYCALTGKRIRRGDAVFMPSGRGRLRPANYDKMILATALERAG